MKDADDKMTAEQRKRLEEIKAERAKLDNPLDRIVFDSNGLLGNEAGLYIIASLESEKN